MDRSLDTGRVNRRKFYGTVIHHAAAGTVRTHPVAVIGTALGALLVAGPCSTPSSSTSLGTALRPAVLVAAVTAVAHVEWILALSVLTAPARAPCSRPEVSYARSRALRRAVERLAAKPRRRRTGARAAASPGQALVRAGNSSCGSGTVLPARAAARATRKYALVSPPTRRAHSARL